MIQPEEVQEHMLALIDMFGDSLPDPEHEPKRFQHYLKMYWYYVLKPLKKSDINTNG